MKGFFKIAYGQVMIICESALCGLNNLREAIIIMILSSYQETIARLWCDYNSYSEQNINHTACVTIATYTYTLYYFVVMLVQLANNFNAPSQYKN